MDIETPPPTTVSAAVKTPDAETETPTRIQTNHFLKKLPPPLTNGVLKRHHPPPPVVVVAYRECLKNHAATIGGHAVDGCGEFMPSPNSIPSQPTSLKCAACGCHRNFHRREPDITPPAQHVIEYQPHHRHHPPPPPPVATAGDNSNSPLNSPSPPPISSSYYPSAPHMLLALSTGLSAPPPENNLGSAVAGAGIGSNPNGKKRFRTKFTQDQKEKMLELAERVGWKMQKRDEDIIVGFCNEIGVDKGVFKVWMHNNKSTIGNKTADFSNNNGFSGGGIDFISTNIEHNGNNHQNGGGNLNGSSSSS